MRKTWLLPVLVILVVAPMGSCNDEDPVAPKSGYKSLSGPRDNVLFNLQKSCNDRNLGRYEELLDEGFLFHFSQNDIDAGIIDRSPWDRVEDLAATKNVFDPNFSKPGVDPVTGIDLVLTYPAGDSSWTPIPPEDHPDYPGETWYEKTVAYRLTVRTGDMWYIGSDILASFVLRQATVLGHPDPVWRIVVWRDDSSAGFALPLARRSGAGLVEDTTWGAVKAVYSD